MLPLWVGGRHQLGSGKCTRSFNNIAKAGLAETQDIKNWFSYLYHYNPCSSHDILAVVFQNFNSDRGCMPLTPSNALTGNGEENKARLTPGP